jgi:hypothetical protein
MLFCLSFVSCLLSFADVEKCAKYGRARKVVCVKPHFSFAASLPNFSRFAVNQQWFGV